MAIMRLCKCLRAEKAKPEDLDEDPNPEHRLLIALWLRHAPRFIQRVLYSGNDMSNLQRHLVSLIIGIIVGLLVRSWFIALNRNSGTPSVKALAMTSLFTSIPRLDVLVPAFRVNFMRIFL